ncbi:coatomer alpha subunit, putative [Entamoeba nuttalli P19]|uniref:Beta'-coat protein n=2 Tax=Entamoeba nuttalli TaxID=412467 RepID=K2HWZ7_ENTNP|nr:coatomer alpha subunit, putative [Entamoeba nuttalli P19]EKE40830.1 coatomer alpha subunit, putative [Entamoeba nuttalli P19]|eukprot:XP_008856840.1 coatomer alpha subunit, putative [Entamoeba nuttalli P19]
MKIIRSMRTQLKYYLENQSERVKTAVFHPTATLLMCSLHNGDIQIWDYRTKILLHTYPHAHNGAVRGLCFHPNRPLVVSGGDDCVIRMWNYRDSHSDNACVGEFKGHSDYIRSTYFHPTKPWILSCSDDRTIRIWNYLSFKCIAILTGHDHYVLSAHFHPRPEIPFVISSSYDSTVRVWDIKDLYENEPRGDGAVDLAGSVKFNITPEQFAVNNAIFHPTLQLIFTCGDDKTIKMWRYNDSSCWSEGVFRGHTHNVTACTVMGDYLISVSEDKCVNVFDIKTQKLIRSFRTNGRIWCIEKHPLENLFAIGCDTGLKVFKLESERPAYFVTGKSVYYQTASSINKFDMSTNEIKLMYSLNHVQSIVAIPQAKEMILASNGESHEAICAAFHRSNLQGTSLCYIGGSFYLSYEARSNTVQKIDVGKSQVVGKIQLERSGTRISAVNRPNTFCLFGDDFAQIITVEGNILFKVDANGLKRTVATKETLVLFGSQTILLLKDSKEGYEIVTRYTETTHIKSVVIATRGVILYTTNAHIKYLLPTGEVGIVQGTGNEVLYLIAATASAKGLLTIDINGDIATKVVDLADVDFKAAVLRGDLAAIHKHLTNTVFIGDSIISFLMKYKFAELALLFVRDVHAKFAIALQCGNFKAALEAAKQLNLPQYWRQLSQKAISTGHFKVAEFSLVQLGDYSRVSYLSAYCGNIQSMVKLNKLEASNSQKLILSLLSNDQKTMVKECFIANGKLGYIAAKTRGFDEIAERIGGEVEISEKLKEFATKERKPIPGSAIKMNLSSLKEWPHIGVEKSIEQDLIEAKEVNLNEEKPVFDGVKVDQIVMEKKEENKPITPKKQQEPITNEKKEDSDDENWDFI